ncbi:MAG: phosphopantetheine-binding protein [Candidatus Sedimenticola sp. (ex Thyasira tokunagai)]
MEKQAIFGLLKNNIQLVLPHIAEADINLTISLEDLGANSIDRSDILVLMLTDLSSDVPMVEFANTDDIGELIDRFHKKLAT